MTAAGTARAATTEPAAVAAEAVVAPWIWAIAAHGLPGTTTAIDASMARAAEAHLDDAFGHGLAGLLAAADRAGALALGPAARARLDQRLAAEATLAVRLEAEVVRLGPILRRHGAVIVKGPAVAHGAYPEPGVRPFTDLDVLVAPASVERVLRDLGRAGYERPRPDPTAGYATHVAKATALAHPNGLVVDLHRTIAPGRHGHAIDVLALLEARIAVRAGSIEVPAPSWEAHLVALALHAVVGDHLGRALSVRDVAQVASLADLDAEAVVALAHAWDATEPLALALRSAADHLGAPLPAPLAALARSASGDTSPRANAAASADRRLEELRHGGSAREQAELWRSLLVPSPAFLRWTYGDGPLPALYLRRWRELGRRRSLAPDGARR
jgi:hypothetical protein